MGKKFNPATIGMFIVGALTITVLAVMILGSAKIFSKTETFVSFFSDSINGLDVGAPVKFKGVTIGKLEDIKVRMRGNNLRDSSVMLIYSVDMRTLQRRIGSASKTFAETMDSQIKEGLRARLNYQSVVTGMLYIELDYMPDESEPYKFQYNGHDMREIPSARSGLAEMGKTMEKILTNVAHIDFQEISDNANALLLNVNSKVSQLDAARINASLLSAVDNFNRVIADPNIPSSLENLEKLLEESRGLLSKLDSSVESLERSANRVLGETDDALKNINTIISPQSPFRFELAMALKNFSDTLSSVRNLAEFIERNPSAMIKGKAEAAAHPANESKNK